MLHFFLGVRSRHEAVPLYAVGLPLSQLLCAAELLASYSAYIDDHRARGNSSLSFGVYRSPRQRALLVSGMFPETLRLVNRLHRIPLYAEIFASDRPNFPSCCPNCPFRCPSYPIFSSELHLYQTRKPIRESL